MLKGKIITPLDAATSEDLKSKADLVNGKVPAEQLPSYVDDVVEFSSVDEFPEIGEEGKIYVALDSNFTYRWSGSEYIQLGGQDLSDYYTKSETDQLLDTKQPVGDYATNTALSEGLATKQPVGDYATNTTLEAGLATKQPVGDYATSTILAPTYDSTSTYAVGDAVTYNNQLYQCIVAIETAEAWDATHWQAATVADLITDSISSGIISAINSDY